MEHVLQLVYDTHLMLKQSSGQKGALYIRIKGDGYRKVEHPLKNKEMKSV